MGAEIIHLDAYRDTIKSTEFGRGGTIDLAEAIEEIKRRDAWMGRGATHIERTITLFDAPLQTMYLAGYKQHERSEGVHMHGSQNVLHILEGEFEICVFNREKGEWGPREIKGPGTIISLGPLTPHLVAPALNPSQPDRLNIIRITTDRGVNIAPGQGYNIPLPSEIPPLPDELPLAA